MWYEDVLATRGIEKGPLVLDSKFEDPYVLISNWWNTAKEWEVAVKTPGDYHVKVLWGNNSQPQLREKHELGNRDMSHMTEVVIPKIAFTKVNDKIIKQEIEGASGEIDMGIINLSPGISSIQSWINDQDNKLSVTTIFEKVKN